VTPEYLINSFEVENIESVGIKRKLSKFPLVVLDVGVKGFKRLSRVLSPQIAWASSLCCSPEPPLYHIRLL
jgi:hypothetical protein